MTFLQINFGYQKALKRAIEIGDWEKAAALKGRHQARLEMNKNTGLRRDENEIAARKALDPTARVENKGARAYAERESKNLHLLGVREPKNFRNVMKKEAQDIINNSTSKIDEYYNDKTDEIHNKPIENRKVQKEAKREARRAQFKENLEHVIHGYDTYGENISHRMTQGMLVGDATGAAIGSLVGVAKRKKAGKQAVAAASKGLKNKILNTIDKDRLKRIENAARKKVSILRYGGEGAAFGGVAGMGLGAGAGALERFLKDKKQKGKVNP